MLHKDKDMEVAQSETPQQRTGGGGCCQCRPVRILRNQCLENNNQDESKCMDFINAFKECVAAKKKMRLERELREAQA